MAERKLSKEAEESLRLMGYRSGPFREYRDRSEHTFAKRHESDDEAAERIDRERRAERLGAGHPKDEVEKDFAARRRYWKKFFSERDKSKAQKEALEK